MPGGLTMFLQLLGLALLLAGIGLSWMRWGRPHATRLDGAGRAMMATVIVTMVGGLAGAPFWWMDYPASFSWDLPPLASRMLASAGLAFGIAGIMVLQRPCQRRIRLYLTMLAVYLAPLVVAIVLFHLDRFDWRAPITYAFFAVAVGLTVASVWHLARGTERQLADTGGKPATAPVDGFLVIVAIITGLWGVTLILMPAGPVPMIWTWPADALSSRLIGTMLLTLGVMCFSARRDADLSALALAVLALYGFGAVLAGLMNALAGNPLPMAYMVVLGSIACVAVLLRLITAGPRA